MKPNLKFLQKVADGKVYRATNYSPNRGGYHVFYGGEKTAEKHAEAGFIVMPNYPGVMRRSEASLTDLGREVLTAAQQIAATDRTQATPYGGG